MSLLAELLFKDYRRQVLGLLLLRPDEAYHVREIARLTNTVPGTLHKELAKLADAGVLRKSQQGNQVLYQADTRCIIFDELSSILRKTSGLTDVLREALLPFGNELKFAAVFGSVASGKAIAGSDIDVLLVGDIGFADAVKALYPAQQQLAREINPKLYSEPQWQLALMEKSGFIHELLSKPMLYLIGGKDDSGQSDWQAAGTN
ncbi:nucleotidyltransferase domain-containing protein [Chromatiaceae bacterium AAb-1]|nr:nucleotidyltransferase domain-containing protein [Chromatiaceae bacterium AAb-1]